MNLTSPNKSQVFYPAINRLGAAVALADINAGKTILHNKTGATLRVTDVNFTARGAALAALTLLRLVTDEDTPTVVATAAVANLTEDNRLFPGATGFTEGAGFNVDLAPGASLVVDKTGSDGTGATRAEVSVSFQIVAPGRGGIPRAADDFAVI